jgi:uncharacterized protein (TIGR03118 family)
MKSNIYAKATGTTTWLVRHCKLSVTAALAMLIGMSALARDDKPNATDDYLQTNLVSDQPGVALLQDTDLVNAWGMSFGATSPFWISDNGSGLVTLYKVTYDTSGMVAVAKQGLKVTIPGDGTPTGQANGSFHGESFLFVSEDGTISGWHNGITTADVLVPASDANVYKGMTLATTGSGTVLLAANFRHGSIDEYDSSLNLHQFMDPKAPAGYAPFNVLSLQGIVYVTFAKQDATKHDDVAGPGNGLIDVYEPTTHVFTRLATGKDAGGKLKEINSPWGLAVAPSTFGKHADQLLVGNFGSGTIMAFEADSDFDFKGLLEDANNKEKPLVIDGLWGLMFGNDGNGGRSSTLYFTAGPDSEGHGLFGAIDPAQDMPHGHDHK